MLDLFLAEFRRSWIQFIRYPFEVIGGVFITTSIFYGLFLGAKYVAGPTFQVGDRFDTVVVGYVLWTLVLFVTSDIATTLQYEAQTGTIEQVFLSPYNAVLVFFLRAIADLLQQFLIILTILLIIIGLTGSTISFPPLLVFPLISLLLSAYGLSFVMGAFALVFKRVQQIITIFQFGLLFVLATPTETWTGGLYWLHWLVPMTSSAGLLRALMARGEGFNWLEWGLALVNSAFYLALGLSIFYGCEQQVKKRGKLSGY